MRIRSLSAHGLWEWLIILSLFAQLTYVNVLHGIVGLYYYSFLVNDGKCLFLVIQTIYPSALSVLYNKDVYPTSSMYDPLIFLIIYLNHIRLCKTLSYCSNTLYFFTLLISRFVYIYVHFYVFIYYYYYHALGALYISFYLVISRSRSLLESAYKLFSASNLQIVHYKNHYVILYAIGNNEKVSISAIFAIYIYHTEMCLNSHNLATSDITPNSPTVQVTQNILRVRGLSFL